MDFLLNMAVVAEQAPEVLTKHRRLKAEVMLPQVKEAAALCMQVAVVAQEGIPQTQ